jgi:hypothetical protein
MSVLIVLIQNQSNKIETICSIPGQPANSVCKQRVDFKFFIIESRVVYVLSRLSEVK